MQAIRVTATQLASRKEDFIFALAEIEFLDPQGQSLDLSQASINAQDSIEAPVRWSKANLIDGKWPQAGNDDSAEQLEIAQKRLAEFLDGLKNESYLHRRREIKSQLESTLAKLADLPPAQLVYAAATEFEPQGQFKPTGGRTRPIHLLHRGEVTQPGELIGPALLPLGPDESQVGFKR